MTKPLINGQAFANSFIGLFGTTPASTQGTSLSVVKNNPNGAQIPINIQMNLPEIFNPSLNTNKYRQLFAGDTSPNSNDHSSADLALCGYFARRGLTMPEAEQTFKASGLYRPKWDEIRGRYTYGEMTLRKAFTGIKQEAPSPAMPPQAPPKTKSIFSDPNCYRPTFIANGMPPREFVGPKLCDGIRLFPSNALSTLVALGAMGKTSLLVSIASHVAAGKSWNGYPLSQKKAVMFFCEEDQEEINRRFSALVDSWTINERQEAIKNLLLIPLIGQDTRLTAIEKGQYSGSGVTEQMIELLTKHEVKDGLVILDHMQGFTAGDLNLSETATAISREANKIVHATGSAVVLAAHISKANIKATEFEQGFAVGSLAFENATRQMSGLIPMTEEIAKKFGLEETRKEYVWLSVAKNSYGSSTDGIWLKKVYSPSYYTIVMEPTVLEAPIPIGKLTEYDKISKRLIDYIDRHPNTTKNNLDALSGKDGGFKCSKAKLREVLKSLLDCGVIEIHEPTEKERKDHLIPKQVKEVLRISKGKSATMPANIAIQKYEEAD